MESLHPGYDEYRYNLDPIGHNPHELAAYLSALLHEYTPQSAAAQLQQVFEPVFTRRKERGKIEIWKKKDGSRTLAT